MKLTFASHPWHAPIRLASALVAFTLLLSMQLAQAQNISIVPTTTLAKETANNTSAANSFKGQSNGNAPAGNVSKSPTRTLLYSGNTTKIYAHFMGWFGGDGHIDVGYLSTDPTQVRRQVADMKSRTLAGAILDWYGQGHITDTTAQLLRKEAEAQGIEFAINEDVGSIDDYAAVHNCEATQKLIDDLNYAYTMYETSPAYLKIDGRPVVFFFGVDAFFIDWARVRSQVSGNPLFIFRNAVAFTDPKSDGAFAWIQINSKDPYDNGTSYLDNFYKAALANPAEKVYATAYPGFNDTLAGWSGTRVMHQQCGGTWLKSFAITGNYYNSTRQLPNLQLATWNDYDEGSEMESGIDNCLRVVAWTKSGILNWKFEGDGSSSTVSYFRVFVSTDGTNLMRLADVSGSTRSLSLSSWSFSTSIKYTFYVKAIGKPSIVNKLSNAAIYRRGDAVPTAGLSLSKTSGAVPLTVTASTLTSTDSDGKILSSRIDFGDGTVVSGRTATHTYSTFDTYTVRAYVFDDKGAMGTTSKQVTAKPATSGVVFVQPSAGAVLQNKFQVIAYSSGALPVTSIKLYVDGVPIFSIRDDRMDIPLRLYDGQHSLTVNSWDSTGAVQSKKITITTGIGTNPLPNPVLTINNLSPTINTTVRACTAQSTDETGISKSAVDFGDGSTPQSGPTAYHEYKTPGRFTVKATVTDGRGATNSTSATVTVQ